MKSGFRFIRRCHCCNQVLSSSYGSAEFNLCGPTAARALLDAAVVEYHAGAATGRDPRRANPSRTHAALLRPWLRRPLRLADFPALQVFQRPEAGHADAPTREGPGGRGRGRARGRLAEVQVVRLLSRAAAFAKRVAAEGRARRRRRTRGVRGVAPQVAYVKGKL
jgi:hypothetical protein